MKIRKIVIASCLLAAHAVTGILPNTAIAQQEADANASQGGTTAKGDEVGTVFLGDKIVPDDEHTETWVSRALNIYAQTDNQESRGKQREEIEKGLNMIFDLRHMQRVKELRELETRVEKLKSTLDLRAASKTEIVKKRLDYLLREADGLGWGDGIPGPKRSNPTGVTPSLSSTATSPDQPVYGESGIGSSAVGSSAVGGSAVGGSAVGGSGGVMPRGGPSKK